MMPESAQQKPRYFGADQFQWGTDAPRLGVLSLTIEEYLKPRLRPSAKARFFGGRGILRTMAAP